MEGFIKDLCAGCPLLSPCYVGVVPRVQRAYLSRGFAGDGYYCCYKGFECSRRPQPLIRLLRG